MGRNKIIIYGLWSLASYREILECVGKIKKELKKSRKTFQNKE
jgi:hypothetical protein